MLNRRIAIVAVAVIATVAFFSFKSGDDRNFQIAKNLDIFNAIVKELDMFYVDTIDPNKTIREGIDNMLYTLDPYTEYYPEEDQSELEQMIKGSFGGIGSYIAYNTKLKRSMISEPFEGTPAAKAGLKAGDILMEIDGKDLAGKNNAEVSQMLRGQAGTSFKLKIERPNVKGGRTPMEFTIVRESIQNPAIPYTAVLDNNIGYIGLSTFSGNPSKEFKKAFLDLKKQGATSLVIDLRSNGGGLLDEAVEIANYFLPRGKVIVTTKGKIKQASNTYKTLREPLDLDIPIAVLVNSGTASASEILSGSLQDLDRAVIVGNRTFGKGLVQVPRSLPYGGTMKVTTSKYYIPSGRCVQAIDYKHRNEDGSVGTIPDSLTKVFHTAAGRDDEAITKRMSGRRVCSKCANSYHVEYKKPKVEGVCDACGGELIQRKDDAPETVLARLAEYHQMTEPLKDFYNKLGKLTVVEGQEEVADTTALVYAALED